MELCTSKIFLNFECLLLGHFQSDRIEGEFGVFRQASGGNYYISYEQVSSSLTIRRLRLFAQFDLPYLNGHQKNQCYLKEVGEEHR